MVQTASAERGTFHRSSTGASAPITATENGASPSTMAYRCAVATPLGRLTVAPAADITAAMNASPGVPSPSCCAIVIAVGRSRPSGSSRYGVGWLLFNSFDLIGETFYGYEVLSLKPITPKSGHTEHTRMP